MSSILVLAFFAAPGLPQQAPPPDPASELVRQLGDKSYRTRTAAAAEIARMGSAAIPALREGAKHSDGEIAAACRRLLPQAEARLRKEDLDALLKDSTAPPAKTGGERAPQPRPAVPEKPANRLAGLEPFLKVTGDNRSARELYAELMGDHGRAIELLEKDAREATRAFNEVGEQLRERMREAERRGVESKYETMNPTPAEIALFLIFSADPRVNDRPRHIAFHYMLVLNPKMKAALTEGTFAAPMRKLFVNWLVNDTSTYFRQFGFTLAADVKLLDFAPAMVQLIEAKDSSAKIRALAMVSLLKSGSEGEVKVLSRYLTDQTEVCADLPPVNGQRIKTQLRDVAMGISLQLAGQHPRDYGWTDERFGPGVFGIPNQLYYYGFVDDKSRDAAHKKWKEWLDKKPSVSTPR